MIPRPSITFLPSLLALLLATTGCPTGRDRGDDDDGSEDDDDSAAADDDDAGDDDVVDDDDVADDDDATGPLLVYASGTYRWFNDLTDALNDTYPDCHKTWDVAPTAGTPTSGCPGCTVVMRVDFLWSDTDCHSDLGVLSEDEPDFPNVELGIAGGSMYQYNGSAWATFMTGDGAGNAWAGESDSQDYGQYLRTQLIDVGWE